MKNKKVSSIIKQSHLPRIKYGFLDEKLVNKMDSLVKT